MIDRLPNNPDYQRAWDSKYPIPEASAAIMALVLETARLADAQEKAVEEARTGNLLTLWEIRLRYGVFGKGLEESIMKRLELED